jgi:hypothetical protein
MAAFFLSYLGMTYNNKIKTVLMMLLTVTRGLINLSLYKENNKLWD